MYPARTITVTHCYVVLLELLLKEFFTFQLTITTKRFQQTDQNGEPTVQRCDNDTLHYGAISVLCWQLDLRHERNGYRTVKKLPGKAGPAIDQICGAFAQLLSGAARAAANPRTNQNTFCQLIGVILAVVFIENIQTINPSGRCHNRVPCCLWSV